jgi:hypothetical protein
MCKYLKVDNYLADYSNLLRNLDPGMVTCPFMLAGSIHDTRTLFWSREIAFTFEGGPGTEKHVFTALAPAYRSQKPGFESRQGIT